MKTISWRKTLALVAVLAAGVMAQPMQTVWNGADSTKWYTDSSSKALFRITTAEQLAGLATLVNNGTDMKNKTITLAANIVLNDSTDNWPEWETHKPENIHEWTAIGKAAVGGVAGRPFRGTFNGAGFVISGIYINKIEEKDSCQGLFGYVDGGTIQNTRVTASYVKGYRDVGGLVGKNWGGGKIENSFVTGKVWGIGNNLGGLVGSHRGTITNCYATGDVSSAGGGSNVVGGLVGYSEGTVRNSYASGNVIGVDSVGGLVGVGVSVSGKDSIRSCYASGSVNGASVVGGLVGSDRGNIISSCYAIGEVVGVSDSVGGLVGKKLGGAITNCYAAGAVSGVNFVGGLVGSDSGGAVTNCYAAGVVLGTPGGPVGGLVGSINEGVTTILYGYYDKDVNEVDAWGRGIPKTTEEMQKREFTDLLNVSAYALKANKWFYSANKYPTLSVDTVTAADFYACFAGGTGETESDPVKGPLIIMKKEQLEYLAAYVNCGGDLTKKFVKLGKDIALNDTEDWESWGPQKAPVYAWTAIGQRPDIAASGVGTVSFKGTFDGAGYEISGVYIDKTEVRYQGLFGQVGSSGTIKNLGVVKSYINGHSFVGGLAGLNEGKIKNCYVTGNVSGTGGVSGSGEVGGLVGKNNGGAAEIENSHATGKVSGTVNMSGGLVGWNAGRAKINACYATGYVESSGEDVGGLVGRNDSSTISNSYATGNVKGTGALGVGNGVGGLVGTNYKATVTNSYAIGRVEGWSSLGGLVGWDANASTVTSSYYNSDIFEAMPPKYGTPKTTEQMKQEATYAGWDFKGVWAIDAGSNDGYPYIDLGISAKAPEITMQPVGGTVLMNGTLVVAVTAKSNDGGKLTYEWYRSTSADATDGTKISGETGATHKVSTSTDGVYYYYVVVTNTITENNDGGRKSASVTSEVAMVTINWVSVHSPDRTIPVFGPKEETAVISPVSALTAGLTVGPNPIAAGRSGAVGFFRAGVRVASGTLSVYDAFGNVVNKVKVEDRGASAQSARKIGSWDLRDGNGRPVPSGAYLVKGVLKTSGGQSEKVSMIVGVR